MRELCGVDALHILRLGTCAVGIALASLWMFAQVGAIPTILSVFLSSTFGLMSCRFVAYSPAGWKHHEHRRGALIRELKDLQAHLPEGPEAGKCVDE